MSDNPMNYSDLFDFSDRKVIEQALGDLELLKKAYKEFNDQVINVQMDKIAADQTRLANSAKKLAEETKKLTAVEKDYKKKLEESAKAIEKLKQENEELKASLAGVNTTNQQVGDSVEELNKQLQNQIALYNKLSPTKEAAEQKKLAKEIINTKTQIKTLNDAIRANINTMKFAKGSYQELEQVNRALIQRLKNLKGGMDSNSAAAQKLKTRIFENTQRLKEFDREINQNFRNVGNYSSAFSGLATNLGLVPPQIQAVSTAIQGMNASAQMSVTKLGLIAGAMIALTVATMGFSKAMTLTSDFEQSIDNLSAITGAGGDDLAYYREQALLLGESTVYTANQVADAYTVIGSKKPELLGNAQALNEVTKETLILAQAAGIELPEAAEAVTQILNKFNADASQTSRVVDILATSFKLGSVDIDETAFQLSKFGGIANAQGITMEQSAAIIQVVGKTVEESGIKLRNVILRLADGADETNPAIVGLEAALENLGQKQLGVAELSKMFGRENAEAALQLIANRDEVTSLTTELGKGGAALEMARVRTDNFRGDMTALSSAIEGTTIRLFESVTNGLRPFVQGLTKGILMLKELPKFLEENKELFYALTVAVISFNAPMILQNAILLKNIAIQKAQKIALIATTIAQHGLNAAIRANPIGFLIGAVSLIIGLFTTLYKRSETVRASIAGLGNVAKEVYNIIKEAFGGFVDGFSKIIDGDFKGGLLSIGKSMIKSTPIGIALTQGKRLGDAFVKGYNKKLSDEKKEIQEAQAKLITGPVSPGQTDPGKPKGGGPTDEELEEARKKFDQLSQLSAEYSIAELKLQKARQEESLENEREFLKMQYGITMASLDERLMLYGKDSEEYKKLQIEKLNATAAFMESMRSLDEKQAKQDEETNKEKLEARQRQLELEIENERLLEHKKIEGIKLLLAQRKITEAQANDEFHSITMTAIKNEMAMHEDALLKYKEGDKEYYDHKKALVELEKQLISEKTAYEIQKEQEAYQKRRELIDASFALASEIGGAISEISGMQSDKRIAQLEAEKEYSINMAGDNAKARQRIEEEYNKKILKEKQKKAKGDKLEALFQIALNTALGISKAVSASPLTFGLPFSAFVAATGIAQAAVVLAKPIPQYWKGREFGPEEVAMVNDRFGPELLEKNGKFRIANDGKPGLTKLAAGEKVHTNKKSKEIIEKTFLNSKQSDAFLSSLLEGTKVMSKNSQMETDRMFDALMSSKFDVSTLGNYIVKAFDKVPASTFLFDRRGYKEFEKYMGSKVENLNNRNKKLGGNG